MAVAFAELLRHQLAGPAAVLLQEPLALLLPAGWGSLAVAAGVAAPAQALVVAATRLQRSMHSKPKIRKNAKFNFSVTLIILFTAQ